LRITLGPKKYMQPLINIIENKSINW
jgi:hypothetical protein